MMSRIQVHLQFPVKRQFEYHVPDGVQLLLCGMDGAVCFFCKNQSCCGHKIVDPAVDPGQHRVIQVQNIGSELSQGEFPAGHIYGIRGKEYGKLIKEIRHGDHLPYPIDFWSLPDPS